MNRRAASIRLLTTAEVAALLEITHKSAIRLCSTGKLDHARVGGQYWVPEETARAYRRERSQHGKWRDIADDLRKQIAGLQPGDRLPTLKALAAKHGTSVTSARSAYRHLEAEGLVWKVPDAGWCASGVPAAAPGAAKITTGASTAEVVQ